MLDINFIRENPDQVRKALIDKQLGETLNLDELLSVDEDLRKITVELDQLRQKRNELDSKIKTSKDESERKSAIEESTALKPKVIELEGKQRELKEKFDELMLWVPNVPADDVPVGKDETGNVVFKTVGEKPKFDFEPKDHLEIGEKLDILDVVRGAKIAGFRGYFVKGKGAILEQALLRYGFDFMVEQGFTPLNVPVLVNKENFIGTGYFPWGKDDHYFTQNDQALIGTAEVSITAYRGGELLEESELPVMYTGLAPSFRKEIGAHGKDTKGVFRVHYFNKVEQVVLTVADEEETRKWHEKMLGYTEQIMQNLGIHYHVLLMCTGDMGAGQRKKYDLEIWFPAQNNFREIGSASYFNDFQSRRLNIKYKTRDGEKKYVYTLNNTVLPTPRMLANILENYQQKDGSVIVPEVLRKYTGFDVIEGK